MSTSRTHRTPIQMRFGDTDALGHVNNASFAFYAEVARLDFLGQLKTSVGSLILARLAIDFRRQVNYGDTLVVETWVASIGRSSVRLAQVVLANGERAADVDSVVVQYDYTAEQSVPMGAELRAALEGFLAPPL